MTTVRTTRLAAVESPVQNVRAPAERKRRRIMARLTNSTLGRSVGGERRHGQQLIVMQSQCHQQSYARVENAIVDCTWVPCRHRACGRPR